jgi:8-amino-7-oxononanoate synthase
MPELPQRLKQKLDERRIGNTLRTLSSTDDLIDFSSNDYLGLARDEQRFHETTHVLSERKNTFNGATGSRLLTGNSTLYMEVEHMLCQYHKVEAALVFNSGYDANLGFFSSVPQRNDVVFYDEFIHASIRDGLKLGNATSYKFNHNDPSDLEKKISLFHRTNGGGKNGELYVVTESVFSMDGDSPDLGALVNLCELYKMRLIVDEAHAVGIFGSSGCGLLEQSGLRQKVFATIATFGKAMGCHGAAVLGSRDLKVYLINFARSFIYTTGLPSHSLASISLAYVFMGGANGARVRQLLQENIEFFCLELKKLQLDEHFVKGNSAIHSCIIGENRLTKKIASHFRKEGFDIKPILPPTVREGGERLRICVHSYNTREQISRALKLLKKYMTRSHPLHVTD